MAERILFKVSNVIHKKKRKIKGPSLEILREINAGKHPSNKVIVFCFAHLSNIGIGVSCGRMYTLAK
jgi:hypothetical protein